MPPRPATAEKPSILMVHSPPFVVTPAATAEAMAVMTAGVWYAVAGPARYSLHDWEVPEGEHEPMSMAPRITVPPGGGTGRARRSANPPALGSGTSPPSAGG